MGSHVKIKGLAGKDSPSTASGMQTVRVFRSQQDGGLKTEAHGNPPVNASSL